MMSNDAYIDDAPQCSEQEMAEMEAEYHFWKIAQDAFDLPEHKQPGYAERMQEHYDMRRKEIKENRA